MFIFYYESSQGLLYNLLESPTERMQLFHLSRVNLPLSVTSIQVRWLNWGETAETGETVQRIALILLVLVRKYLLDKRSVLPPNPRDFFPQWDTLQNRSETLKGRGPLLWVTFSFFCGTKSSTMPQESQESTTATKNCKPQTHSLPPHHFVFKVYCNKTIPPCPLSWIFKKTFLILKKTQERDCSLSTFAVCYHLKWCKYQHC